MEIISTNVMGECLCFLSFFNFDFLYVNFLGLGFY